RCGPPTAWQLPSGAQAAPPSARLAFPTDQAPLGLSFSTETTPPKRFTRFAAARNRENQLSVGSEKRRNALCRHNLFPRLHTVNRTQRKFVLFFTKSGEQSTKYVIPRTCDTTTREDPWPNRPEPCDDRSQQSPLAQ